MKITLTLAATFTACLTAFGQESNNSKLWYDKPAKYWVEALPVGNGRIGAMVFGGVE
ncbi:MAG TPA: glycoside hydrolase N-terminal domain-containing protein, partial [Dyadobacter sp.]|nr:glycoside hydrolase N-terminal domain-containing protein [Dyadobacter sp.]